MQKEINQMVLVNHRWLLRLAMIQDHEIIAEHKKKNNTKNQIEWLLIFSRRPVSLLLASSY